MSEDPLWAIDAMTQDVDLQGRIRAAVAQETAYGTVSPVPNNPTVWAAGHVYQMAVAPQWGEWYAYATETGVEKPGLDPGVISDGAIRSQVVAVVEAETPEPE